MTNEELLEKVRAEIERLIDSKDPNTYLGVLKIEAYKDVLSLIDSMQEECNITGIKSKEATGKLKECIDNITDESLTKARKQLQEEPKECMYSKDNYTDEDRKALCDGCEEECKFNKKEDSISEDLLKELKGIVNIRECVTQGVPVIKIARHFANWQKEQLMAKAVDATVHIDAGGYPYIPQMELYDYEKDIPFAKEGDKYKVVLIKED